MAALFNAFGMRVMAFRRSAAPGVRDGITFVTKEELLAESDVISLHCPLTAETAGLVNRDFLNKMKTGSYLINTSRGAVVDETALADALISGKLSGAALDVMVKEPPDRDNPLLALNNCILTPHCAWTSLSARKKLMAMLADNIRSFLRDGRAVHSVL